MRRCTKYLSGVALAAIISVPAVTISGPGWAQIPEITVTTRKREENLQNVPISVEVFGSGQIEKLGLADVEDLTKYSPSLIWDQGFSATDNRISIRGLSQSRGRPSSAILVDGIDVTSESVGFSGGGAAVSQRLLDIERIEVVKGPQSALYGRSAFAGAVQFITKDPSLEEIEGNVGVELGSDGLARARGGINGPVAGDKVALGLNGNYWTENGYHEHPITGQDVGGGEGWGLAATLLVEPNDDWKIKGRVSYSDDEYDSRAVSTVRSNQLLATPAIGCAGPGVGLVFSNTACGGSGPYFNPVFRGTIPDGDDLEVSTSLDPRTGGVYEGSERDVFQASLNVEWDLGIGTLSSWTGYTDVENSFFNDGDLDAFFVPGPGGSMVEFSPRAQEFDFEEENEQFSQELRFATNLDGPVQFTIGGLYWEEDIVQTGNSKFSDTFGAPANATSAFPFFDPRRATLARETEHWSVYGVVDWEITDRLKLHAEARYAEEETMVIGTAGVPQDFIDNTFLFPVPDGLTDPGCFDSVGFPCFGSSFPDLGDLTAFFMGDPSLTEIRLAQVAGVPATSKESYWTPRVILEWAQTDDLLFYASAAEGIKPGGISTLGAGRFLDADGDGLLTEFIFDAETLWSYEVGLKGTWLDGTLRTNIAGFFQDYTDKQVGTQGFVGNSPVPTGVILNAGEAEIWGLELDTLWQPNDNWTFGLAYTFLDTEYTEFEVLSGSAIQTLRAGNCTVVVTNGVSQCQLDLSGNQIEFIPEHALALSGRYSQPIEAWKGDDVSWFIEANSQYQSERFADETNRVELDSYWLTDLRVGLQAEEWDILFYVNNLLDDDTVKSAIVAGGDVDAALQGATGNAFAFTFSPADNAIANLPDPRVFGVRANIRF